MSEPRHFQPNPNRDLPCASVRDDLHAWALGATEPGERERIERHLSGCAACQAEADRWSQVSSAVPLSLPPVAPSAQAKERLMDRIAGDQTRGLSPRQSLATGARDVSSRPSMLRRFPWSQALVAPLILALIVMSAWAFDLQDQVETLEGSELQVTADDNTMLPAGVQTYNMKTECQQCTSAGRLLADPQTANALFVAWNLDPAMVHQVWCVDDQGAKTLVASLQVNATGDVVQPLLFQAPIADYSQIYVMSRDADDEQMMEMSETPMSAPPLDAEEAHR